ncbi:MAG TPA: hypothetical protein VNQ90_10850 [Chthoniobacteraceae bacterium]|nr:hypothetical protein [Chthoniobacteraceae bacterium]
MRIVPALFSALMVALGLWLIASSQFDEPPPPQVQAIKHRIEAKQPPQTGPAAIGFALVAGGVLFFMIALRR